MNKGIFVFLLSCVYFSVIGQGVTTAELQGKVVSNDGKALLGASVILTHIPTNYKTGTVVTKTGFYFFSNLRVGGPYRVEVSFLGYSKSSKSNLFLHLGEKKEVNFKLVEENQKIKEVVIKAKTPNLKRFKTHQRVLNLKEIERSTSMSARLIDYFNLSSQANITDDGGVSFSGASNRLNSFYIDGAINNDVFGLSNNGTYGGQSGVSIISDETIQQLDINLAPYDVEQSNFLGASINAITKSGTNKFSGSTYFKYRDENLAGKTPSAIGGKRENLQDFTTKISGLTFSGPLMKDKLFFFTNLEILNEKTPLPFDLNSYKGKSTQADLNKISEKMASKGYKLGGINGDNKIAGKKFMFKLDWHINQKQRLSLKNQYTSGKKTYLFHRSDQNALYFANTAGKIESVSNTSFLELNSRFSPFISNSLKLGYTYSHDDLTHPGDQLPSISIEDGSGTINFGTNEYFSNNYLTQYVASISDRLNIYLKNHKISIGTHNEFYRFKNYFIPTAWGAYNYNSLNDFLNDEKAYLYRVGYSRVGDNKNAIADTKAFQLGFFAQDEFRVLDNLKLNFGLRLDIPVQIDEPNEIPNFNEQAVPLIEKYYNLQGAKSGSLPSSQFLWSPRISVEWKPFEADDLMVKAGLGIFTSRLPMTLIGGAFVNDGVTQRTAYLYDSQKINLDVNKQFTPESEPLELTKHQGGTLHLFSDDFKFPQALKTSLSFTKKLIYGIEASVDFLYTKAINSLYWKNVNLKPSTLQLEGTDNRTIYNQYGNGVVPMLDDIILVDNTNKGYSYNATANMSKSFESGLYLNASYTYGVAKSIFESSSTDNLEEWLSIPIGSNNRNELDLSTSNFDLGHKIVSSVSYSKKYFKHLNSIVSLTYRGQSGKPFSYVYNNHHGYAPTNMGWGEKNLIFVPEKLEDINLVKDGSRTPEEQWNELNEFIESDSYLKTRRGKYAERNESRLPFVNKFDFHFAQEIFANWGEYKNALELSIDIYNFGNLLNSDWGVEYYSNNGSVALINYKGMEADGKTPKYNFTKPPKNKAYSVNDSGTISSRWQAMIGIKYKF